VTQEPFGPRSRPTAISFAAFLLIVSLLLGETLLVPVRPAAGMQEAGNREELASGTPVAGAVDRHDPLDGDSSQGASATSDPLDGDLLDGLPADGDSGAPEDQAQLEIVRSARPHNEPATLAAYDDDPQSVWTPQTDAGESWLWLDLGLERRLREVRWLAQGTGIVEIAVSNDAQRWREVDRVDVDRDWQGVELRDDARYVRLTLLPTDDGGELPAIAEAAVYGSERRRNDSLAQRSDDDLKRDRGRQARNDRKSATEQKAEDTSSSGRDQRQKKSRSSGRVQTSAEPGETHCRGDRARCEAQRGEVSIESDCEREGTCTIDVRVDGGTAVCDSTGGATTKADDAEGRRGGNGGRCEAAADGGAVAIGDVNP
jgi:hypothetical protein